jgi:hypothetical protein
MHDEQFKMQLNLILRYKNIISNLHRYPRLKVIVCNAAAHNSCVKAVQLRKCRVHERSLCSFSNITSHGNRLLLLVKQLVMLILTGKYRIRQLYPD